MMRFLQTSVFYTRICVAVLSIGTIGCDTTTPTTRSGEGSGSPVGSIQAFGSPDLSSDDVGSRDEWMDVLSLIELPEHIVRGTWERDGQVLIGSGPSMGTVLVPITVEGSYDLEIEFTRTAGNNLVGIAVPVADRKCVLGICGWGGEVCAIDTIDRKPGYGNPSTTRGFKIENGVRYVLRVSVRINAADVTISASVDNRRIIDWTGNIASLDIYGQWRAGEKHRLHLLRDDSDVVFHEVSLALRSEQTDLAEQEISAQQPGARSDGNTKAANRLVSERVTWAKLYIQNGNPKTSEKLLLEALAIPDATDFDEAKSLLRQVQETLANSELETVVVKASKLLDAGDINEAATLVEQALANEAATARSDATQLLQRIRIAQEVARMEAMCDEALSLLDRGEFISAASKLNTYLDSPHAKRTTFAKLLVSNVDLLSNQKAIEARLSQMSSFERTAFERTGELPQGMQITSERLRTALVAAFRTVLADQQAERERQEAASRAAAIAAEKRRAKSPVEIVESYSTFDAIGKLSLHFKVRNRSDQVVIAVALRVELYDRFNERVTGLTGHVGEVLHQRDIKPGEVHDVGCYLPFHDRARRFRVSVTRVKMQDETEWKRTSENEEWRVYELSR